MPIDTINCEKAIQLLIKTRGSSRGNTGSTPHFESGESPVSHEGSKIPLLVFMPKYSIDDQSVHHGCNSVKFFDQWVLR
jgi:hypothetical protein